MQDTAFLLLDYFRLRQCLIVMLYFFSSSSFGNMIFWAMEASKSIETGARIRWA